MDKTELIKKITSANIAYSRGIPFITDTEYDVLWKQLYDIDPTSSCLYHTTNDPTLPLGISPHIHKIMGTNKAFNLEDLKPFMARFGNTPLILEPKYDGCAAVWYRGKDNLSHRLILEGNGESGRDVTHHLEKIFTLHKLRSYESVELIIPNIYWQSTFGKNVRSTVAGWLAKDTLPFSGIVEMVPHNNINFLHKKYSFDGDYDKLLEILLQCFSTWSEKYKIDGVMIKVLDEETRMVAGNNGTTSNWSIAWKPPIQTATTIVSDIEWNVSRSGRVVPTVIYDPIMLCNTFCSRVTGNNAQWIRDNNIVVGNKIKIGKAGEIIPKILSIYHTANDVIKLPEHCPVCGAQLTWNARDLMCTAEDCTSQLTKSIAYFYSDKGMDVKTIGEQMIFDILQHYLVRDTLKEKPWALLDPIKFNLYDILHEVWGAKRTFTFMNSLSDIKGKKHAGHFIAALGMPGLAYKTAVKLLNYVQHKTSKSHIPQKSIDSFIIALSKYYLAEPTFENFSFIPVPSPAKITYCITGTLSSSRNDMIHYLEKFSWAFSNQVSKFTDILIVGSDPGKTKITKAKELNVLMLDEEELIDYIKKEKS